MLINLSCPDVRISYVLSLLFLSSDKLVSFGTRIEEDDYEATKTDCLYYGGKLTDVKRRQRRLAGEAEALCSEVASFSTFACPEVDESGQITVSVEDETNFDMDRFKRESSTAPLTLLPTPLLLRTPCSTRPRMEARRCRPKTKHPSQQKTIVSEEGWKKFQLPDLFRPVLDRFFQRPVSIRFFLAE